ncbi:Glutaredoxin domain-containing protein [Balamuthia mandrillaris]
MRLFWFPYNINGVQARFVGLFVVVTCILGIIFRESKTMQWSIAGMAAGYLLRFFSGANASFLGSLAGIPAFFFEPDLVPGPPKQFAALCGFLFSAIATALLFIAEEGGCGEGCYIAGSAVLGFLSFAAFLESVFDFCVGCVFFGIFVKMGIVPRALLEVADDAWEETNNAVQEQGNLWDWFYTRPPTNERRPLWQLPKPLSSIQQTFAGGRGVGSKEAREDGVEMVEKKQERQPEAKKESRGSSSSSSSSDSDEGEEKSKHDEPKKKKKKNKHKPKDDGGSSNEEPIEVRMKNAQTYERRWFNGWGQRFRYVPEYQDEELCEKFPEREFKTVLKYKHKDEQREFHFIRNCKPSFAGAIMGLTGVASVWKFADQQVFDMKEGQAYWASMALVAAFFGTLFLVLYLLKIICYPYKIWKDWNHPAAPLILLDGMYSAARWFSRRWYVDHINPTWMIPPVGSLVASFVAPILDSDYNDVAWLWFGFGIITWLPIFCIIVQRCITAEELEDKVVPSLFILIAPLALAGSSWVLLRAQRCACNPWQDSPLPEIFFYSSIGLTLIMAMLVLFRFFGRLKFDMAYWGYTFPIATVSLFTLQYHEEKGTNLSQAMAVFGVILISYLVALCFLQTITAVLRRDVFVPDDKWGPLSFTNIWHEAFRYRLPRIVRAAKGMKVPNA